MATSASRSPPFSARLGNPPSVLPDVPVTAVFLVLFLACLGANGFVYWRNQKHGHHFWPSLVLAAFCIFRLISTALRIAWACNQNEGRLGIANQAFFNVGVAALYIVNVIFAQRIMRARQPWFGWSRIFGAFIWSSIAITLATIIMITVVVAQSFLTTNGNALRIDRDIELYCLSWFVFVAILPVLVIGLALALPRKSYIDKFGSGRFRWKLAVLTATSLILTLEAGWRCGATAASPLAQPPRRPWYFSPACFYVFTLMLEVIVLIIYFSFQVDQRFHIPDGASGVGSYSGADITEKEPQWPEAVYLPVTQVHQGRNAAEPVFTQDFLQVDPRTGRYELTNPPAQDTRTSLDGSVESRRGRWSRTSWEWSRRSHRSLHSQMSRPTPRRSQTNASYVSRPTPPRSQTNLSIASRHTPAPSQSALSQADSSVPPPPPVPMDSRTNSLKEGANSVAASIIQGRRSTSRVRRR